MFWHFLKPNIKCSIRDSTHRLQFVKKDLRFVRCIILIDRLISSLLLKEKKVYWWTQLKLFMKLIKNILTVLVPLTLFSGTVFSQTKEAFFFRDLIRLILKRLSNGAAVYNTCGCPFLYWHRAHQSSAYNCIYLPSSP